MPAVVIRQRKAWRRRDGLFLYFEACIYLCSLKTNHLTYLALFLLPILG
jgi:ribosomal protein L14